MGSIEPTREQIEALMASSSDAPIVMVNLLRFADQASYPEGFEAEPCTGEQAYMRYAAAAQPFVELVGARPIWGAPARGVVIGPEDESWDMAFCVSYPSRKAFLEMALNPDYLAITPHRSAALADSRLIVTEATDDPAAVFGIPQDAPS